MQQYSRGDNQWPGDIAGWRKAGGSHISVVTMGANLTTVDAHIAAIKRWRDVYNSVSARPYRLRASRLCHIGHAVAPIR